MYKDVGKELKNWAKFIVVLLTIPSIILGVLAAIICAELDAEFLSAIICIVIIIVGYFFARLAAILLYAYGELVDNTSALRGKGVLKEEKITKSVLVKEKSEDPVADRNSDGSWDCPFCDNHNPSDAKWCNGCKIKVRFK